jgi:hypothetical protein
MLLGLCLYLLGRSTLAGLGFALAALVKHDGASDRSNRAVSGGAWLPLLQPSQMRLPGPLEAEGFLDLDAQWRELFEDASDDAEDVEQIRP